MRRISFAILLLLLAPHSYAYKTFRFLGAESPKAIKIRNDFLSRVDLKSLEVSGNLCVGIGNVETFDGCDEAYWFLAPVNSHLKVPGFSLFDSPSPEAIADILSRVRSKPRVGIIRDKTESQFVDELDGSIQKKGGKLIKIDYQDDIGKSLIGLESESVEILFVQTSSIFADNIRQVLESLGRRRIIVVSTIRGADRIGASVVETGDIDTALEEFIEIMRAGKDRKDKNFLKSSSTTINKGLIELYDIQLSKDGKQ